MGLFDFLKKKNTNAEHKPTDLVQEKKVETSSPSIPDELARPANKASKDIKPLTDIPNMPQENNAQQNDPSVDQPNEPYYGDLEKTGILVDLCATPQEKRDENWFHEFITNLPLASFKCGDPQVMTGPDGFPYFQLELPEPGVQFQCYVVDHIVYDFLMTNGMGIVINAKKEQPDWVFTYGDVVNYAIKKDFYNKDNTSFNMGGEHQIVPTDMNNNIMVGQPSEFILPDPTRAVLRSFLQYKQINDPKVLLMTTQTPDGREAQDLVFNFTPKDFASEEEFQATAQQMQWFLPRHYSLAFFGENESLKDHFSPL